MTAIRMKNNNDNVVVRNARLAVKTELEKKRMCNQVIAKFDLKTKKVYLDPMGQEKAQSLDYCVR